MNKYNLFNKERIISIVIIVTMLMPFGGNLTAFSAQTAESVIADDTEVSLGSYFLKPLSEKLPQIPDGFMKEPEKELPYVSEGFILPIEKPYAGEEYKFIQEPEYEIPKVTESGFIREVRGLKQKPSKGSFIEEITASDEGATVITTADELAAIDGGNYVLGCDIYLDEYNGGVWTPVEISRDLTLDGQGYVIYNINTDRYGEAGGLFSEFKGNVLTVKNLGLSSTKTCYVESGALFSGYVGGRVTLYNCFNEMNVTDDSWYAGGFFEQINSHEDINISFCANRGSVSGGTSANCHTGGIAGSINCNASVNIYDSFNMGGIKGSCAGGLVGSIDWLSAGEDLNVDVRRCENSAKITADATANEVSGGGIVGNIGERFTQTTGINYQFIHCKNTATVSAKGYPDSGTGNYSVVCAGGIVGSSCMKSIEFYNCTNQGGITTTVTNEGSQAYSGGILGKSNSNSFYNACFNKGRIISDGDCGGLCGYMNGGDVTYCINNAVVLSKGGYGAGLIGGFDEFLDSVTASYNTGKITAEIAAAGLVAGWFTNSVEKYSGSPWIIKDCFNTGDISQSADSEYLHYNSNAGIAANGIFFIKNCYNTGKISNGAGIAVVPYSVLNCANYGVIERGAGIAYDAINFSDFGDGRIENCFNAGQVTDGYGIVYLAKDVVNCYNTALITDTKDGNLTYYNCASGVSYGVKSISYCYNKGEVRGGNYCTGIAYVVEGNMSDCFNEGEIYGDYVACGLAVKTDGNITNCSNRAKVEVVSFSSSTDGSYRNPMGGIVGDCLGKLKNCFNSGDFIYGGKSECFGGVAGRAGGLENCYNTGLVSTKSSKLMSLSHIGGLAGEVYSDSGNGEIINCYNIGDVYSPDYSSYVSGIASWASACIRNCINSGSVTGGNVAGISVYKNPDGITNIALCVNTGKLTFFDGTNLSGDVWCGTSSGIGNANTISDCINTADVSDSGIGVAENSITNCVNLGSVTKIEKETNISSKIRTRGYGIGTAPKISYCINKGNVVGGAGIGGGDEIRNCINDATVLVSGNGGGISDCAGVVSDCINRASVSGAYVGGVVFDAKGIERCENTANITASVQGGGIAVESDSYIDCKNSGSVSGKYAGGIGVCAFYHVSGCENSGRIISNGFCGGGIIAGGEVSSFEVDRSISGENRDYGVLWRPEMNSAVFYNCTNYGDVSGNYVSGIGDAVSISGCVNYGNLSSTFRAAGIGFGRIYGCENHGNVTSTGEYGAGAAGLVINHTDSREFVVVSDCKNTGAVYARAKYDAGAGGLFDYTCENAYVSNSVNSGSVKAHSEHTDAAADIFSGAAGIGRVVVEEYYGENKYLYIDELSKNTGAVSATVDSKIAAGEDSDKEEIGEENVYTAQILGSGNIYREVSEILPESVSISGPELIEKDDEVQFSSVVLPEDAENKALVWSSDNPTVASVSWDGVVKGISRGKATITAKTYNGIEASQTVEVLENAIYVTVMGFKKDAPGKFFPLEGARVRAGGAVKVTDELGKTWFERADLPDAPLAPIHIDAGSDYVTKDDSINLVLNSLGTQSFTYYLQERDDSIYIKSAFVTVDGEDKNMLTNPGMVHIPLMEGEGINKKSYYVNVDIDWGKYEDNIDDRRLWIEGVESGNSYSIYENGDYISIATFFDEGEPLRLVATTKNEEGEEVRTDMILPLNVKLVDVKLNVVSTENLPIDKIYFLDKLGFKIGLGDIGRFAEEISVENGVLTVKFKINHSKKEHKAKLGILSGDVGPSVDITGTVKIPLIVKEDSEWSGSIGIKATGAGGKLGYDSYDDTEERTVKIFNHEHNFFIGNVPCYIDVEFGAGVEASLGISGRYDEAFFDGKIGGFAKGTIGGGVGGSINDNFKLKFGPEGSLEVELPVEITSDKEAEEPVSFEPQLTGRIDAVLEVEFYDILKLAPKVELGEYTWNRHEGGKWEHLLDRFGDAELQSIEEDFDLKNASLTPKGRDYLKDGGGFENSSVSLMSASGEQRIYSNILSASDAQTVNSSSGKRIIFTTDDPERDSYNVMKLVYTDYANSTWTEPVEIDSDGTIDCNASADGDFVAWENVNSKIGENATVGELLEKTDIKAAVFDGEKYVVESLSSDGVYDYSPKVKSHGGKAMVAWLTNSECDITASEGSTDICWRVYDGVWSETRRTENVGQVTNLNVIYDGEDAKIVYKKNDVLYIFDTITATTEILLENSGRYAVEKISSKIMTADFDSEGVLHIKKDGIEEYSLETAYNKAENPVIISDGNAVRIFWTEKDGIYYISNASGSWSGKLTLKEGTRGAFGISGVSSGDGFPAISYYSKEESLTHLNHISSADGNSLTAQNLIAQENGLQTDIYLDVYNNTEYPMENVSVIIQADNDIIDTDFQPVMLLPGERKTLTLSVSSETLGGGCRISAWAENNDVVSDICSVVYDGRDISVASAFFTLDEAGDEYLNIHLKNEGKTKIDSTDVSVFENSEDSLPLYTFNVATLNPGEVSQIRIPHVQNKDSLYFVRAACDEDVDESNNFDIIAYERVQSQTEDGEKEITFDSATKELIIRTSKEGFVLDEGTVLAALYDESGNLLEIRKGDFSADDEYVEKTFTFTKSEKGCYIKIMYVSGLKELKPLRKAVRVAVN